MMVRAGLGVFASTSILVGVFVLVAAGSNLAAAHPVVPAYERFSASEPQQDSVRGGLLLLSELNCTACHAADAEWKLAAKQAPRLDEVAQRLRPEYLREFLLNPAQADAGTTMPHLLHGSDGERAGQVEALVHYLASTGELAESAPVAAGVNRGRQLFHSIGCLACHDSPLNPEETSPTSISLAHVGKKYALPGLAKFLQDPLHVRPSGRMPQLNLTAEEARDLACFLLRDLQIPTSMTFEYYEGHWDKLPDFDRLAPKATGGAASFDVNVGAADHFAVRFTGKFRAEQDGQYRFFLVSDDGSRLLIDGREVLVNDGIHALTEANEKASLTAGEHEFVVEYFEGAGEQELRVEYQGRETKRQSLEFALVLPEEARSPQKFQVDSQLAAEGQKVFNSAGCAACHTVKGKSVLEPVKAPRLAELQSGGCLAETPRAGVPFFALSGRQRQSLQDGLTALRTGAAQLDRAEQQVAYTLLRLNCVACHERDGLGGVETARNAHFRSTQPEMGDEGRLPPSLNGVGAKLKPGWLRLVFDKGPKDRPYMLTRMPTFGQANAGQLAEHFGTLDRAANPGDRPLAKITLHEPERRAKAIGRQLVGERGMSCIKCHTWGKVQATGIQAISMTSMTRRLDHDWFVQYLIDPQKYRPGTRMPAAWPGGQSLFANILGGDARQQIEAVWQYLADGTDAAMPIGIGAQMIELVAEKEPVIYRNFIDGAGPRGIAVAYPERVSMAFDADHCRLALVWQGAFMDASMHWLGRGQGFQKPLGDNVLALPAGRPLATLKSLTDPWPSGAEPDHAIRFLGYRLDAARNPIFRYRFGEAEIEDATTPEKQGESVGLRRELRVRGEVVPGSWLRAVVAKQIKPLGGGQFQIDGDWRVRVTGDEPAVREGNGQQELLIPLRGSEVVTMSFEW